MANTACAIMNIMTALIFIILVSQLHAFPFVVVVRSFLHALVAVAVKHCFQQKRLHNLKIPVWGVADGLSQDFDPISLVQVLS